MDNLSQCNSSKLSHRLQLDQLKLKLQTQEKTNSNLSDKLTSVQAENLDLTNKIEQLNQENSKLQTEYQKKIEVI